jgi:hypothetical protein
MSNDDFVNKSGNRRGCNHADLGSFKGKRGLERHDSRPVSTPAGIFGSTRLAADHYNIWQRAAIRRAERGSNGYNTGWFYL